MAVVEVITGGKKVENVIVGVPQPMSPPGALPPDIGYVEISTSDDRGSIWDTGEGPPTTPASQPGDMYLDVDTGDIYRWNGTEWVLEGNFAPGTDTPEEILAKIITVDGEGSLLDADTLDGHDSTYFATQTDMDAAEIAITGLDGRMDNAENIISTLPDTYVDVAGDTMTGALTVNSTITATGSITAAANFNSSTANALFGPTGAGTVYLRPNGTGSATGQTTVSSAGNMAVTGTFTVAPPATTASMYVTAPTGAFGSQLFLSKGQANQTNLIWGRNGALARWYINLGDGAAESGSDAGSNFVIAKHNDAGSGATQAFNITRSTGVVGMPLGATTLTQTAGNNSTSVATTAYVDAADAAAKTTANTDYVNVTGDTMTGNLSLTTAAGAYLSLASSASHNGLVLNKPAGAFTNGVIGRTATANRWTMYLGNSTAEGGSDTGSNFSLTRHNDAGATVDNPLSVVRSTGKVVMPLGATLEGGKAALSEAPVDGLTYGRKDAAWATIVGGAIVSDTPPVGPAPGQMWYEADSGNTYIWYSDADSSQWVQQNIAAPISGMPSGLTAETRNRLVNPCFQISQENGNTASSASGYYAADQWSSSIAGTGTWTTQRVQVTTPNGSVNRFRATATVADVAMAAGDYYGFTQTLEGIRVADFRWGTASARQVVLRFGWKSPAGTYCFSFNDGVASYIGNIVISAGQANTDTTQTFVIPGTALGLWPTGAVQSLMLWFTVAAGTAVQGVAGWQASDKYATASQTNGVATAGNVFELYDVGLYMDPLNTGVPPRWQMPDEAEELRACQRYWQVKPMYNYWYAAASNVFYVRTHLPVQMRTAPATSLASGSSITYVNASTLNATAHGVDCVTFFATTTAAGTASAAWNAAINARM